MPLSAAQLEGVEEGQRDAMLGERLYALLMATHAAPVAGKVTGMLLELEDGELLTTPTHLHRRIHLRTTGPSPLPQRSLLSVSLARLPR